MSEGSGCRKVEKEFKGNEMVIIDMSKWGRWKAERGIGGKEVKEENVRGEEKRNR